MPEVILKFKIPEEREELAVAQQGGALHAAAHDFANWIRAKKKYANVESISLEEVNEEFWGTFGELLD